MRDARAIVAELATSGLSPAQNALVMELALEIGRMAANQDAIAKRRTDDAARQAKRRSRHVTSQDITGHHADALPLDGPPAPNPTPPLIPHPESESERERAREPSDWPDDFAPQVWEAYGQGREKKVSMQALLELKRSRKVPWQVFLDGIRRQAENVEVQFRPSLQRFIKREKWLDEYTPTAATGPPQQAAQRSLSLVHVNGSQANVVQVDRKPNPHSLLRSWVAARE